MINTVKLPEIELTQLKEVVAKHPGLYEKAVEGLPKAKELVEEQKNALNVVMAKLYFKFKDDVKTDDNGKTVKLTESAVNHKIIASSHYQAAHVKMLKAKTAYDELLEQKEKFNVQAKALSMLTSLHASNYFNVETLLD